MRPDATDLDTWADRYEPRVELPRLVRRLIHETTPNLERIDFPGGEGVSKHGVDGEVVSRSATPFVPLDFSVWELGCDKEIGTKANKDFNQRTTQPGSIDPARTTFIFVTPRRWSGRRAWELDKRKNGPWLDVRAYDADNLEEWLEQAPATSAWLAGLLGHPTQARDLQGFVRDWVNRTDPATPDTLLLAGREPQQQAVLRWLLGDPGLLSVASPDTAEAAAFVAALARRLPPNEREQLLDRAVVVRDDETLRQVAGEHHKPGVQDPKGLLIVAMGCDLGVVRGFSQRHRLMLAEPAGCAPDPARVELGRLDRQRVDAVLQRMGFDERKAAQYAKDSHGDLSALRGLLGERRGERQVELAPLLLVGAWSEDHPQDTELVLRITGWSEAELQQRVLKASIGANATLERVRTTVRFISRLDAWRQLADVLTRSQLDRFRIAAVEVLTTPSPALELPLEDRSFAALFGKPPTHSPALADGLVTTLALLATEPIAWPGTLNGVNEAQHTVYGILARVESWQQWSSIDTYLPLLAEAAPRVFLERVEALLDEPEPLREWMKQNSGWSPDLPQGLVHALETLAWSPELLFPATDRLAALAGLGVNSAFRALCEIFLPLLPHTMAVLDQRISALDALLRRRRVIGWKLLQHLLPSRHPMSRGTRKPAFRSWASDWAERVSRQEFHGMRVAVWDRLVQGVEQDPSLWVTLLPDLHNLSRDVHLPRALEGLRQIEISKLPASQQSELRAALRHELHRHRRLSKAPWVLPEAELEILQAVYERLEPQDLEERVGWLFERGAPLPDLRGSYLFPPPKAQEEARRAAAMELLEHLDLQRLIALAQRAGDPHALGLACGSTDRGVAMLQPLLRELQELRASWARELRQGWVGAVRRRHPDDFHDRLGLEDLLPEGRAEVALALPYVPETWNRVESWGEEARTYYWRNAQPWFPEPERDLERAVSEMLGVGRAYDAFDLAATWSERGQELPLQLLVQALDATAGEKFKGGDLFSFNVGRLLGRLAEAGPNWHRDLVRLQWAWFPVLEQADHLPHALYAEVTTNHELFVTLALMYRGESDEPHELTEQELARARQANDVLDACSVLPGTQTDGSIDSTHLRAWVDAARELAAKRNNKQMVDARIGQILAYSPAGNDGYWPHEAVRELFESLTQITTLRREFTVACRNHRGVYSKGLEEGGEEERTIAARYKTGADALRHRWHITAGVLDELSDAYMGDARREDQQVEQTRDSFLWRAEDEDRLAVYTDELQIAGRHTFSREEALTSCGFTAQEFRRASGILCDVDYRLLSPEDGFFVVIPLEYGSAVNTPPEWYLDEWMRWSSCSYAVGLLSAACIYGAHPPSPDFHVLLEQECEAVTVGGGRLEFIADSLLGEQGTRLQETRTGHMRVTTPEKTALDLVVHAERLGGIDKLVPTLSRLGALMAPDALAQVAALYSLPTVQRLGFLLDRLKHKRLSRALRLLVKEKTLAPASLREGEPTSDCKPTTTWRIVLGRELNLDDTTTVEESEN
jgi:hypothetical protein